jgi:hypothetical protein
MLSSNFSCRQRLSEVCALGACMIGRNISRVGTMVIAFKCLMEFPDALVASRRIY